MGRVALIGFGEAGETFATAAGWGDDARMWDIVPARRNTASAAEALAGAPVVLSLVTAGEAAAAARDYAPHLAAGALWCDMNSVAPSTKRAAADAVHAAGGRYVDVAVMAPVNPARLAVPLLIAGPHAAAGETALRDLGFSNTRVVGDAVGRASTIKMLRSVMYKGVEALTAECLIACARAGVTDEVLVSFGPSGNGDWATGADYRLDRMLVHGRRRAEELREVARTLEDLGVPARMSAGTVAWQQALGELRLDPPGGLAAKLAAIREGVA